MPKIKIQFKLIVLIIFLSNNLLLGQKESIISGNSSFINKYQGKYLALESCFTTQSKLIYTKVNHILNDKLKQKHIIEKNNKYTVIDNQGRKIDTVQYEYISAKTCAGFYFAFTSGNWTVFDENLNRVSNERYEDVFCYKQKHIVLFKKNNKWGIFDEKQIVKPPEFDFLKVINNSLLYSKKGDKYSVISMKGKEIYDSFGEIKIKQKIDYSYIYQNKKIGLIYKDSLLFKPKYSNIYSIKQKSFQDAFLVETNKKWFIYLNTEKIPLNEISVVNKIGVSKNLFEYYNNNFWGLIKFKNDTFAISEAYYNDIQQVKNAIGISGFSKYFKVKKNDLWGIINSDYKKVIDNLYDDIQRYNDEYFIIKKEGKWGIVNTNGNLIVEPEFDYLKDYCNELVIYKKGDIYGLMTIDNKKKFESNIFFKLGREKDKDKLQFYFIYKDNKLGVIDTNINLVLDPIYDNITNIRHLNKIGFLIEKDGQYGLFYNNKFVIKIGEISLNEKDFKNDCIFFQKDNKYGLVSRQNKELVVGKPKFEQLIRQKDISQGYKKIKKPLIAKKDGKWGLIDYNGNKIADFIFDEIRPFDNNLYIIKRNNNYGLLDKSGTILSGVVFSDLKQGIDGYLLTVKDDKRGVIDIEGNIILQNLYDEINLINNVNDYGIYAIVKKDKLYGLFELNYSQPLGLNQQNNLQKSILKINPKAVYSTINYRVKIVIPVKNKKLFHIRYFPKSQKRIDLFISINDNKYLIYDKYLHLKHQDEYEINIDKKNDKIKVIFNNGDVLTINNQGEIN